MSTQRTRDLLLNDEGDTCGGHDVDTPQLYNYGASGRHSPSDVDAPQLYNYGASGRHSPSDVDVPQLWNYEDVINARK